MSEWKYQRTNKKGEVFFKRTTEQPLAYVEAVLRNKGIPYMVKMGATMIRLTAPHGDYVYYWTTGRWQKCQSKPMDRHYHSKSIDDFLDNYFVSYDERREREAADYQI